MVWAVPASYSGFLPEDIVSDQDKFYICQYCPQLAALNHTVVRAHVTHGGAHSLAESYAFGVPVLVIPQFTDQPHNAAIARDRGAGLTIDMPLLTAEVWAHFWRGWYVSCGYFCVVGWFRIRCGSV